MWSAVAGLLLAIVLPWLRLWFTCRQPDPADECVWGVPLLIAQVVTWLPVIGGLGAVATYLALAWRARARLPDGSRVIPRDGQ